MSDHNGKIDSIDKRILHLDATYEERYSDAYFNGAVKYLYPGCVHDWDCGD